MIFDFDGTIVDSKAVYYHAVEKNLGSYGFKDKEIERVIDLGESISEILGKFGFSWIKRLLIKRRIMKDVMKHANEIKKCRDADSLRKIKACKILISNSLKEFIIPVLKHLKIKDEFDEIYGADDFNNKAEFIKNYIKSRKINCKDCYYIGDRVADVKVAREVKCKSVIVSNKCSWDSKKEIMKEKPDFVIFDLADLREVLG